MKACPPRTTSSGLLPGKERRQRPCCSSSCCADSPAEDLHEQRLADIIEAGRQGPEHLALDAHVVVARWDFDEADIDLPVDLWHGALDDDVPLRQARRLTAGLPRSTLHIWPRHGHDMPSEAM